MNDLLIKEIETEAELEQALALCYRLLGERTDDLYGRDAWHQRWRSGLQPMVFAQKEGQIVSAVLGCAENNDSLIIGFVACDENFRRQGITSKLMAYFETLAISQGFKYITLGSKADGFYEKCGYKVLFRKPTQNVYQKKL